MGILDFLKNKKKDSTTGEVPVGKLEQGLDKTKTSFFSKLGKAVLGKNTVDEAFLDDLEDILIASDVGVQTTVKIIERLEKRVEKEKYFNTEELNRILMEEIYEMLSENKEGEIADREIPDTKGEPFVIMVVGVNGVGKTTTIGKLAYRYKQMGKSVILGAGDTFRAAAVDQLQIWSERAGVPLVTRGMNADPAAVAYDTVESAKSKNADVVILDTAGRLHNKVNLMNELSKIKRVVQKVIPDAPHEILLVLDASTGQNAIQQAKEFTKATNVTSIALTKLDGTAKGGVVIGITDQLKIPVKYIGIGEKIEDLKPFDKEEFIYSFFK